MAISDYLKGVVQRFQSPPATTAQVKRTPSQTAASLGTYGPAQVPVIKKPASDAFRSPEPIRFSNSPAASTTPMAVAKPPGTLGGGGGGSYGPSQPVAPAQAAPARPPTTQAPAPVQTMAPSASAPVRPPANISGNIQTFADGSQINLTTGMPVPKATSVSNVTTSPTAPVRPPAAPVQPVQQTQLASQPNEQLEALRRAYLGTFAQTSEEQDALARLREIQATQANLAASRDMGLQKISEQPIVLDLIRGQQQALQGRAAVQQGALTAQAQPLEAQITALQAQRALTREQAKAALGFTEADIEADKAEQKIQREANKPIEIGGNLVQLNPATGQYEAVYQSPTDTKPVTLSQGQVLVDPTTGEQIAVGPEKDKDLPAAAQEYQFAQQSGFTGSFMDYLEAKQASGQSVPSSYKEWQLAGQPGSYSDFLSTKGAAGGRPLSGAEARLISEGNQLAQALDPLREIIDNNAANFGPLSGRAGQANPYDTTAQTIDSQMRIAAQTIGRYMEGGVLRAEDEIKYRRMLPQLTDTPAVAKQKLDQVEALLKSKQKQYIDDFGRAGFDVGAFQDQQATSPASNLTPQQQSQVDSFRQQGYADDEIEEALGIKLGFNSPLGMGVKGPAPKVQQKATSALGTGVVTAYGSPFWKHGLDYVLSGGPNAPVKIPSGGTVIQAGPNGGFGNQVKIRLDDGKEMWISHLNAINVKKGQRIAPSTVVGLQGNTGSTIKSKGGTGTHLDITMPKPGGGYYTAQEVAQYIGAAGLA